ncbi:uncharacterized protein PAC_00052 [Phialocephala subalpina]|uniref:Uncharacterized protein n=1 Tax=Phialocephala subalpina TaxID=576137 RepID=A0A1L7WBN2_9HELO|nr:uncharacterized protein PAC_00052 [Phialocephala subalpina]
MAPIESQDVVRYNNGYGDFCFGRWTNRSTGSSYYRKVYDQQYWEKGSNGVTVPELNGFKKEGPFPFFKLPLHLREEIYHLLLGPLYIYSTEDKYSFICLTLKAPPILDDDAFDRDYDSKLPYEPQTTLAEDDLGSGGDRKDRLYLEWLRKLSNVSTLLRKELTQVFWVRIRLNVNTWHMRYIPALLEDRPQIHSRIKQLHTSLNFEMTPISTVKPVLEEFSTVCDGISPELKLDQLDLFVDVEEYEAEDLVSLLEKSTTRVVSAIRRLQVSKRISLDVFIYMPDGEECFDTEDEETDF